jgi:transcription elongation factor Elf1
MIDFVDLQYAQFLSGRLEQFRIRSTNPYKINFRCPICGDSQKSRSKARGWLLERDSAFFYYCHNCGESQTFSYFLKTVDPLAFKDYVADKFFKNGDSANTKPILEKTKFEAPVFKTSSALKSIKKISQLNWNHPVKKYIENRMIPSNQHYRLYYTPKFKGWINSILPNKFENIGKDEPRLVIPFFDENKKMFGVSARGFDPKGIRYITIMFDDRPKLFGLDTVNFNRPYYVVEGAIDSFFVSNSVAMAGADGNVSALKNVNENAIFVFDAEPRNKEIHKRMEKIIDAGYKICIWPNDVPGKDINEMILNGLSNVENVIKQNVYKGLEAKLKFMQWRKS